MRQKYLLPCECGEKLLIDVGQAGLTLNCQCGRTLEAPMMTGFRELEPVTGPEAEPAQQRENSWSMIHGVLFAAGVLLAVAGLTVSCLLLFQRYQLDTHNPFPDQSNQLAQKIDSVSVDESWALWVNAMNQGLTYRNAPEYVLARRRYRQLTLYLYAALAVLALGLAAAGGAALARPKEKS